MISVPTMAVREVRNSEIRRPRTSEIYPKSSEPTGRAMNPTAKTIRELINAWVSPPPGPKKETAKNAAKVV